MQEESRVMKGVLVSAAVVIALMAAIKDGRVLRQAGLTGKCTAVAAPQGETGEWQRCTPGKLEGAPNLTRQGCTAASTVGKAEYWHCPAPIGSAPGT
jgi:hypothetical protein